MVYGLFHSNTRTGGFVGTFEQEIDAVWSSFGAGSRLDAPQWSGVVVLLSPRSRVGRGSGRGISIGSRSELCLVVA